MQWVRPVRAPATVCPLAAGTSTRPTTLCLEDVACAQAPRRPRACGPYRGSTRRPSQQASMVYRSRVLFRQVSPPVCCLLVQLFMHRNKGCRFSPAVSLWAGLISRLRLTTRPSLSRLATGVVRPKARLHERTRYLRGARSTDLRWTTPPSARRWLSTPPTTRRQHPLETTLTRRKHQQRLLVVVVVVLLGKMGQQGRGKTRLSVRRQRRRRWRRRCLDLSGCPTRGLRAT